MYKKNRNYKKLAIYLTYIKQIKYKNTQKEKRVQQIIKLEYKNLSLKKGKILIF